MENKKTRFKINWVEIGATLMVSGLAITYVINLLTYLAD